jgi:hypothetical protein
MNENFKKVLSKRFETFSKAEGYAKHTPTLRKPKFRFSNEWDVSHPLYVIRGRNPL